MQLPSHGQRGCSDLASWPTPSFRVSPGSGRFVDGNKRAAFAAADVFLRMNGRILDVGDVDAYEFIVGSLEDGQLELERTDRWLRTHTTAM